MKSILTLSIVISTFSLGISQEKCLKEAWIAYENNNWDEAIKQAESCVIQFGPKARKIQEDLEAQDYEFPCDYNVPNNCSPQQKNEIFSHGLLNDVATSYWIIGMSNLRLQNKNEAKEAFEEAKELTFGLCYDPEKNNFWSPSKEADLQLDELNEIE